jgi:hypothetical protein
MIAALANAQTTAFTYQGQLKDAGLPANGIHDFRFRLFDAGTGGTLIGTTQCVDNILVTAGTFTATMDFGNQFSTTAPRFIEVQVRRDTGTDCSDPSGFTILEPRQPITPAPLATHARSAFTLDAPNGSIANAVFVDNTGKVGIGTIFPTHSLHIAGTDPTMALQDTNSSGGAGGTQVGYVSLRDNSNTERGWIGYGTAGDPDLSIVNARSSGDIVLSTLGGGNVGIGTSSPLALLDVRGDIRLGPTGALKAVSGDENLRIVRGTISSAGTVVAGSGFSLAHPGVGLYIITFNTAFSATPTIATSGDLAPSSSTLTFVNVDLVSSTSAEVILTSGGAPADIPFHFIAAGPR